MLLGFGGDCIFEAAVVKGSADLADEGKLRVWDGGRGADIWVYTLAAHRLAALSSYGRQFP